MMETYPTKRESRYRRFDFPNINAQKQQYPIVKQRVSNNGGILNFMFQLPFMEQRVLSSPKLTHFKAFDFVQQCLIPVHTNRLPGLQRLCSGMERLLNSGEPCLGQLCLWQEGCLSMLGSRTSLKLAHRRC